MKCESLLTNVFMFTPALIALKLNQLLANLLFECEHPLYFRRHASSMAGEA